MKHIYLPLFVIIGLGIGALSGGADPSSDNPTPETPAVTGQNVPLSPQFTPPDVPKPSFNPSQKYNVMDFGAIGNGTANDAPAINQAIQKCNAEGGGSVVFPAGTYSASSIHIMSNVQLLLDPAAIIIGANEGFDPAEPNAFGQYQDFGHSHFHDALLWGENIDNFAIVGGTITGGNMGYSDPRVGRGDKIIAIKTGNNLLFKDVAHPHGGHFVYLLNNCANVTFDNITIKNSRDGVDLMSCRNVLVHGCNFTGCGDDTLGIKSDYALGEKIKSENIYVWDCYFESGCNALQFGSETAGDFNNINMWNIKIGKADKAGIGITSNDGGIIENVNYWNITMSRVSTPIYMLITKRLRTGEPGQTVGTIRNVKMYNIMATDVVQGKWGPPNTATISGLPDSEMENIDLENVKITYEGGGTANEADIVPPYTKNFAPRDFGPRPASGLYVRHVKGLKLHNVEFLFEKEDQRPSLSTFDVDGLEMDGFISHQSPGTEIMRLEKVENLNVSNSPGLKTENTAAIDKMSE